jgi:hypothetical protein
VSIIVNDNPTSSPEWDQFRRGALVAGLVGLGLCLLGAFVNREQVFRSYLVAYCLVLGITLGSMAIIMLQHLTGGAWGLAIRRVLEAATRTLPWLVLLFVPLLLGLQDLYAWARLPLPSSWENFFHHVGLKGLYHWLWPVAEPGDATLVHKSLYLNIPFFVLRAVVYFAAWTIGVYFLNRLSREQDRTADPRLGRRFRAVSGPGLVVYGLTMTFASIDWVMSLQAHWFSTIFGVLFIVGQVLAAFAFAIGLLIPLAPLPPLNRALRPETLRDLGSLMLAFVMLWAYMAFSQFLLIWSGNLVEEIPWYLRRLHNGWQWVGVALIVLQFAVPFFLLLSTDIKRNPRRLSVVAGLVLAMRFVDLFWMIEPATPTGGFRIHWLDAVALVGVGGIWLAAFAWQLKQLPLLPIGDPYLAEATTHG